MSQANRSFMLGLFFIAAFSFVASQGRSAQDEAELEAKLNSLLEERRETLRELIKVAEAHYRDGQTSRDAVIRANNRLLTAELALLITRNERISAYEKLAENLGKLEQITIARHKVAVGSIEDVLAAKVARLKAEADLIRAKLE